MAPIRLGDTMLALRHGCLRACHLCQTVIGIVMIHGAGGYELMFDENGRWNRPLIQDIQAHSDYVLPIALRKISNRSYKTGLEFAQFCSAFRGSILPHDDAVLGATGLLKCAQRSESAGIGDCTHQHTPGMRRAQMSASRLEAGTQFSISIQITHAAVRGARQHQVDPDQQSRQTHSWQVSGPLQLEQYDLVDFRLPVLFDPAAQISSADQARLRSEEHT